MRYAARVRAILVAGLVIMTSACGNGRNKSGTAEAGGTVVPMRGVVAHRGASVTAPENTLAALRLAWALGAESSEIDVRVTADGHVVLMHDADTRRTGGRAQAVDAQTLAELRE